VISLGTLLLAALADASAPAAGRVVVESATTCPTAAEVEERLRVILPPSTDGEPPEHASLAAQESALRVRLRAADGTTIAERTLTVAASCADRANVVAVVIAAWDVQQRAERVEDPSLPRPPRPAPPAPPTVVVATPAPPPPPVVRFELALAPGATVVDGALAPSGTLSAALWGRRLGGRLAFFGLLPRTEPLGNGEARWTRAGVAVEAAARASGRLGRLDGHAGLVAAALVASGRSFDVNHDASGLSPGAIAGASWSYVVGRLFVGAGASVSLFPSQRLVFQADPPLARTLPRLQPAGELLVGAIF
jgi:hypothetical protein